MENFDYLNFEDIKGNTLLLQSVIKGNVQEVEQIILLGSDINHINQDKENILTLALKLEDKKLIKEFFPNIKAFTSQQFSQENIDILFTHLNHTQIDILSCYTFNLDLATALKNSDYELTKALLEKNAKLDFDTFTHLKSKTPELHLIKFLELFEQSGLDKKDARYATQIIKNKPKQVVWDYLIKKGYTIDNTMSEVDLQRITINQKEFKKIFLEPLTEKNYKDILIWEIEKINLADSNSIFELVKYIVDKGWDINLEQDEKSSCGRGIFFYMLDNLHYDYLYKSKENQKVKFEDFKYLYEKVLKQTNINQMPFGNPLYFEALVNIENHDKKILQLAPPLDFSLTNIKGENFLLFLSNNHNNYDDMNSFKSYLKKLEYFLENYQFDVNQKNDKGESFLSYTFTLFIRSTSFSPFDDILKKSSSEIVHLIEKVIKTQHIDVENLTNREGNSFIEMLEKVSGTKNKILAEKIIMDLNLSTKTNTEPKRLKI